MPISQIVTTAPAKIIISGEHAIVHGAPALAMTVNLLATTTINSLVEPIIKFNFPNINHQSSTSFSQLAILTEQIKLRYQQFISGHCPIEAVLINPAELIKATVALFAQKFRAALSAGISIHIDSAIPVGCGMGSSAATIISLLRALTNYFARTIPDKDLLDLARECENFQHGHSSGLDLFMALNDGCYYFTASPHRPSPQPLPRLPFSIVNTGKPQTSTGACVNQVAHFFKDLHLIAEFSSITNNLYLALQKNNFSNIQKLIRANQKLLEKIGVVPTTVANFIAEIEQRGYAAKISGAGSTNGEQAGIVIIFGEKNINIGDIIERYGYTELVAPGAP